MIRTRSSTQEHFKKALNEQLGSQFEVIGKYLNEDIFITIKHHNCNNTFSETPKRVKNNPICPYCQS